MPALLISPAEKSYIEEGIQHDCRADGRGRLDYRHLVLETGLLSQASGSARGRLGDSDVLVGVKVEIGTMEANGANEGRVVCSVECSPSASQQFEGRGGDEYNNALTVALDRVFNGPQSGLDLASLCIIPKQTCWVIYIDAMVMDAAGNLLDCIVMTTRAALFNARIPKTDIIDLGEGEFEFEVTDDVDQAEPIAGWALSPITVTLYKIAHRYVIDPTLLEELAAQLTLTVAVNPDGAVCGIQKGGNGSIEPSLLNEMIQTATTLAKPLLTQLDQKLALEHSLDQHNTSLGKPLQKLGFFAAVF
ncbi:ribosomal protein S5 domain 2-type protein [Sporodiniella umbellata]|nr:ribosomal protein S5 domain 2-type protein [Sporodiniella umbellata]